LFAGAQALSLTAGQSSLVYSLPKTKLVIEVEVEKTSQKPGVFYRYSERYLATTNVITAEKATCRLKSVSVKTVAVPDSARTFQIAPDKSSQLTHLSVNAQGILCGINVPVTPERNVMINKTIIRNNETTSNLLPLGEEYMMAGSEAKLAEGAAKQIYRIRESRLGLLTSDVEKVPADGASMKSMLDGLDKMEKQLTELFTGSTTIEVSVQKIQLTPATALNNEVLFRLSALRGLVAADDLSGMPYYITVKPQVVAQNAADPKAKIEKAGLYYVLPATTEISIGDGINTNFNGQFFVPQFGKIVPLPESLFKQKEIKVRIDEHTGRLLGIE
jgi:hypothetical protein